MTARDVAKWFTDAVVVVKTPDGNGTGMIVGSDDAIMLHRADGAEFLVPLDQLSKPDQSFIELLRRALSR